MQNALRRERGAAALQAVVAIIAVAVVIVVVIRIVPVYSRAYELRDFMRNEAKFAGVEPKTPEGVRSDVYRKAIELNLPVEPNQIQSSRVPGGIQVACRFSVPVDLFIMKPSLSFEFTADTRTAY